MKASEVRIGNLCKYHVRDSIEGDSFVINTIDYEDIRILFGNEDEDYIPIPLTEEWLLKFGFMPCIGRISVFEINLRDISNYKALIIYMTNGQVDIDSTQLTYIKYVHQLQNLYFALTGEELELK